MTQNTTNTDEVQQAPTDGTLLWTLALHVDTEFIQRGSFYLLGESMLVVGLRSRFDRWTLHGHPS
jgi:hypothetical protein